MACKAGWEGPAAPPHKTCPAGGVPGDRTLTTGAVHECTESESPGPQPVRSVMGRRGCYAGARGSRGPPLPGGSWRSRTQEACRQEGLRVQKFLVSSRPEPVQHQELWEQDAMQAMQPPCEAQLPSATPQLAPRDELPTPEPWRQLFRGLRYREAEGPGKICSRLRELCRRWLEPQHSSKEQMLELVVLEQFLAILPPEMWSWVCGCRVETCAQAVALSEGFQLGQVEDEKLQVTVRVKVEEGSSDKMQPPGALLEFADSQVQQPKTPHKDRPLEEAGDQETPEPEVELPHIAKEEPPPNPEPGAGTLSRADQPPPEEGPVKLKLQRLWVPRETGTELLPDTWARPAAGGAGQAGEAGAEHGAPGGV
ncbi:zinc finger protein 202-like [Alligator mississippiensis]|uniref:Zinc finger protein 202-like n=1 Tax=Alligator mississippiensis TaxID=8496 RepID=A0A151P7J9_ALLMI|nr:zinc finger protein 202-like [Alligator mississippiensis]